MSTISCSDLASSLLSYHHIPHSISIPTFASSTILYNFLPSHSLSPLIFLPSHCLTLLCPACLTLSSKSLTFEEIHHACPNLPPHPSSLLPTVIPLALPCHNIPLQYNRIPYHSPLTTLPSLAFTSPCIFHIVPPFLFPPNLTYLTLPDYYTLPYPRLSYPCLSYSTLVYAAITYHYVVGFLFDCLSFLGP